MPVTREGDKACAEAYASIPEPSAEVAYNHAGCLAQQGQRDAAFERLQDAVDHEFVGDADIAAGPGVRAAARRSAVAAEAARGALTVSSQPPSLRIGPPRDHI